MCSPHFVSVSIHRDGIGPQSVLLGKSKVCMEVALFASICFKTIFASSGYKKSVASLNFPN